MAQTLVRVFFNKEQVVGVVIPDHDEELDLHHKKLLGSEHYYVDISNEDYLANALESGQPDPAKLFEFVSGK